MNFRKFLPGKLGQRDPVIPVIRLAGAITPGSGFPTGQTLSLANVALRLEKAFTDKAAPAIAISINSPGGSPVQSRLIYSRIRELAEEHEKKVLVFVEDVAASGGYMLALAGDEIIVDETSIIGSIGVVSASFGFNRAIEKLGIDRRVYSAGKNKVILDPFQPEKKADIDFLKTLQLDIHQVFIDMVKNRRGDKLSDDKDLFTGRFWTGQRALELGLVDHVGHMSEFLKTRFGKKTRLKLIQQKRGLFGRSSLGAGIDLGSDTAATLVNSTLDAAEERFLRSRFGL